MATRATEPLTEIDWPSRFGCYAESSSILACRWEFLGSQPCVWTANLRAISIRHIGKNPGELNELQGM